MQKRAASLAFLVVALGVGFGFVGVVLAIAHASWSRLPGGVEAKEYVTVGRREAVTGRFASLSVPDYLNFQAAIPGQWGFANRTTQTLSARNAHGGSREVTIRDVSTNFFNVLGVEAALGELFAPHGGVVVSFDLWQRWYEGSETVVGSSFDLRTDPPRTIIGVAPAEFADIFGSVTGGADAWTLSSEAGYLGARSARLRPIGKLIVGTLAHTEGLGSIDALATGFEFARSVRMGSAGMGTSVAEGDRLEAAAGLEAHPRRRAEAHGRLVWLAAVTGVMFFLFFLALVDRLIAAQETDWQTQTVRVAVGASPKHLFLEALFANALWLLPIAALAVLTFHYAEDVLLAIEPFASHPGSIPLPSRLIGLGAGGVLLFATFVGAIASVAHTISKTAKRLDATTPAIVSSRRYAQRVLVCITVLSLLAVASLAGRYLVDAGRTLGFHSDLAVLMPMNQHDTMLREAESHALGLALRNVATIRSSARTELPPLFTHHHALATTHVRVAAPDTLGNLVDAKVFRNAVDADYFQTIGVGFLAGRPFGGSSNEVVVSRTLANLLARDPNDAIGMPLTVEASHQGISFGTGEDATGDVRANGTQVHTVVGVVRDVPYLEYDGEPLSVVYQNGRHRAVYDWHVIRFVGDPGNLADLVSQSFPTLARPHIILLQRVFDSQFAERRSVELVLATSAAFTLVLAVAGIWASLYRTVTNATATIGVHLAVGATVPNATALLLRPVLVDLVIAAALLAAVYALVNVAAPGIAPFELWLAVPTLALVLLLCMGAIHTAVRQLTKRPLSELVAG